MSSSFRWCITGIDQDEFDAMSGGFTYLAGRAACATPTTSWSTSFMPGRRSCTSGATITLLNHHWHLVGIIEGGKLARVVVPLETLAGGDCSHRQGDRQSTSSWTTRPTRDAVIRFIQENTSLQRQHHGGYHRPLQREQHPGLSEFIYVVMGIGVVIGFAVVCLSMYMAVLQRTREIGILKVAGRLERLSSCGSSWRRRWCWGSAARCSASS